MAETGTTATERMVLRRERVLVLPEGATDDDIKAAQGALTAKASPHKVVVQGDAWVEIGIGEGDKLKAIEKHAGKPNTADAVPGTYRAPAMRSWKGGATYERPAEPLADRTVFDG